MIDLKELLSKILGIFKTNIFLGDYTSRALEQDSSLTSSSSDDAWLRAALAAICADYYPMENIIFKGYLSPNSKGYFEIFIYSTVREQVGTNVLPQYSYGTWRKWQNVFWIISTNDYTFSYTVK